MRYLSVCSGIEAASVAWEPLGWEAAAYSEISDFPSAVLAHRFPNVPNLGDMTKYREWDLNGPIDLLVGGTPCQSFSVAGLRKGLDDPRGNLALVFLGLADRFRPRWILWENVAGALSSGGGRDFGSLVGGLGELGYGWSYRILDAQHFGVPQRRRRVFLVGHLGDWRRAAAVLSEPGSLQRNPAPGRRPRRSSGRDSGSPGDGGADLLSLFGDEVAVSPTLRSVRQMTVASDSVKVETRTTAASLCTLGDRIANNTTIVEDFFDPTDASEASNDFPEGDAEGTFAMSVSSTDVHIHRNVAATLTATGDRFTNNATMVLDGYDEPIAFGRSVNTTGYQGDVVVGDGDVAPTLSHGSGNNGGGGGCLIHRRGMGLRRLTPLECERLQGFPDGWTQIPWNGKAAAECPDTFRYAACGNSMAVPVMHWIGRRIAIVDSLPQAPEPPAVNPDGFMADVTVTKVDEDDLFALFGETPSEVAVETPSEVAVETPSEAAVETPSEAAVETPSTTHHDVDIDDLLNFLDG